MIPKKHTTKLNNLFAAGLPPLTLPSPLDLQYLKLRSTYSDKGKRVNIFFFKVTKMFGEKEVTHLPKSAFCWEQELLHSPLR